MTITMIENCSLMIMMKTFIRLYQLSIEKDQIKNVMRFFHVIWNESGGRPVCVQVWVTGGLWRPTSVPEKTHHPPNGPPTQQPRPHASLLLTTTLTAIPVQYTTGTLVWPYHVLNYSCLEMSRYFMRNSGGNKEDARRRAEVSLDQVSHGLLTTH